MQIIIPYVNRPFRALYIFATIVMFIAIIAGAWYFLIYMFLGTVQAGCQVLAQDLDTNSTYYGYTDTFNTNLIQYFLVLALIGLGYWVYVYAQKKKEMYYGP